MALFKLNIEYPRYRDMLGGGFVDTARGYVEIRAKSQDGALKKVPAAVKKFDRKIDGDSYKARPISLVQCSEHVVHRFRK